MNDIKINPEKAKESKKKFELIKLLNTKNEYNHVINKKANLEEE